MTTPSTREARESAAPVGIAARRRKQVNATFRKSATTLGVEPYWPKGYINAVGVALRHRCKE
jgi:hypothetical protein